MYIGTATLKHFNSNAPTQLNKIPKMQYYYGTLDLWLTVIDRQFNVKKSCFM